MYENKDIQPTDLNFPKCILNSNYPIQKVTTQEIQKSISL